MNEQQVVTLFERTAEVVPPDVARLVAAGADRGRRARRRRSVGTTLAAAALAGAGCMAAAIVGDGSTTGEVATPPPGAREVAVARDEMSATLAGLLDGARPLGDDERDQREVQSGVVAWRGTEVRLTIDARGAGIETPARERCDAWAGGPCDELSGGVWYSWITTGVGGAGPDFDDTTLRVYERDGYVIEASALEEYASARDRDAPPTADHNVLLRLARDEVWLR